MKRASQIKKVLYFLGIHTALLMLCVSMSYAQQISGTVVDDKNEPKPSVTTTVTTKTDG